MEEIDFLASLARSYFHPNPLNQKTILLKYVRLLPEETLNFRKRIFRLESPKEEKVDFDCQDAKICEENFLKARNKT